MRRHFKKLALVLVIALVFTSGVYAGATNEHVRALLNREVKITYNGELQELKDAHGTRVYPLTYNGSTYLPARAICNMTGTGVDWDGKNNTVLLGDLPTSEGDAKTALLVDRKRSISTKIDYTKNSFTINDMDILSFEGPDGIQEFETGVGYHVWNGKSSCDKSRVKYFDVKGFKKLNLTVGAIDNDVEVSIYKQDGEAISVFNIKKGQLISKTINLRNVEKIGFGGNATKPGKKAYVYFFDPILSK